MLITPLDRNPRLATDPRAMSLVRFSLADQTSDDDLGGVASGDLVLAAGRAAPPCIVITDGLLAALPELGPLVADASAMHLDTLPLHARANAVPEAVVAAAAAALRPTPDLFERLQRLALAHGRLAVVQDREYSEWRARHAAPAFEAALADVAPAWRDTLGQAARLATTTFARGPAPSGTTCQLGAACACASTCAVTVARPFQLPLAIAACDACARLAETLHYAATPADALHRGEAARLRELFGSPPTSTRR